VLPNTRSTVPPDEQFYGESAAFTPFDPVWKGWLVLGVCHKQGYNERDIQGEEFPMVMIGYGENHSRDVQSSNK
jgi:hypothetical protein